MLQGVGYYFGHAQLRQVGANQALFFRVTIEGTERRAAHQEESMSIGQTLVQYVP
jgi:hypothetical protein